MQHSVSSGSLAGKERSVKMCQQQEKRHRCQAAAVAKAGGWASGEDARFQRGGARASAALGLGRLASVDALGRQWRADAGEK